MNDETPILAACAVCGEPFGEGDEFAYKVMSFETVHNVFAGMVREPIFQPIHMECTRLRAQLARRIAEQKR